MVTRFLCLLPLVGIIVLLGCSGRVNYPKISGSVTLDGKPLSQAVVEFFPQDQSMTANRAKTDDEGKFTLTPDSGTGFTLKPGSYKVAISKLVDKKGNVPEEEDAGQQEAAGTLRNILPAKYGPNGEGAGKVDIKEGDNQLPAFQLKSK